MFIKPKEEKPAKKKPTHKDSSQVEPPTNQPQEEELRAPRYKKFIFLSSRVHPGETNS
jgi:hypothetical protein